MQVLCSTGYNRVWHNFFLSALIDLWLLPWKASTKEYCSKSLQPKDRSMYYYEQTKVTWLGHQTLLTVCFITLWHPGTRRWKGEKVCNGDHSEADRRWKGQSSKSKPISLHNRLSRGMQYLPCFIFLELGERWWCWKSYVFQLSQVPPKPEPKQCTKPEPFQLESLVRHEDEMRREMEERMRMEREEAQKRLFKAQPVIKE